MIPLRKTWPHNQALSVLNGFNNNSQLGYEAENTEHTLPFLVALVVHKYQCIKTTICIKKTASNNYSN